MCALPLRSNQGMRAPSQARLPASVMNGTARSGVAFRRRWRTAEASRSPWQAVQDFRLLRAADAQ